MDQDDEKRFEDGTIYEPKNKCMCKICGKIFGSAGNLRIHIKAVHEQLKDHECELCDYKCSRVGDLKKHLSNIHDIGPYECAYCVKNRYSQIPHVDQFGTTSYICRECFNKATGKDSRIELQMSEYLDSIGWLRPHLISSDRSFSSIGGCSLKRPDKLYFIGDEVVIWVECDENQHQDSTYSCDIARISEGFDEFKDMGMAVVVIRWNPHTYIPPDGYDIASKGERLEILLETIDEMIENPPEYPLTIYYLFYDEDTDRVSDELNNKFKW